MTTIEDNKLIAEFMGWKLKHNPHLSQKTWFNKDAGYCRDKTCTFFEYSKDWNWLMPVVEKIESLGLNLPISIYWHSSIIGDDRVGKRPMLTTDTDNNTGLFFIGKDGSRIENTFTACIEFIKWYNDQQK